MKLAPNPAARVFDRGDSTLLLGRDGVARSLGGDSAQLARAILDFVTLPKDRSQIVAHLEALVGGPVEPISVVDELLALLCEANVLYVVGASPDALPLGPSQTPRKRVVLGLTGAVASIAAPELVARLLNAHCEVEIALTRDARRFVAPLGLSSITHRRVYRSLWHRDPARPVPHIQLAEWADLVLVCPASATTLARIAQGDCSDLVSAIAIATRAPVLLVPSMNQLMLSSPSVQRNLEQLRGDGFHVARPGYGVEAARAPAARTMVSGPGLSLEAVVEIARFLCEHGERRGEHKESESARLWEQLYRDTKVEELPWFCHGLDAELAAALERLHATPTSLLDIGTGPGTVAIEMAARGFHVTATDIAPTAIAQARQRNANNASDANNPSHPVTWLVDDLLDSRLEGPFSLVHDRGCLHTLPVARLSTYATQVTRLTAPGGHLLLKTHRQGAPHPQGTIAFSALSIATLFGEGFDLVHSEAAQFRGPGGQTSEALFCVLKRK